ncbi:MAG: hypothetical protein R3E98_07495 [Gemmatimonadota bacterium]
MSLGELLGRVVGILTRLEVPYMLTGSLAAAHYSLPRATQDVDLVIELGDGAVSGLVDALAAAGFYVSPEAAREAIQVRGSFNAIDAESGWKVDFIPRKERPFSRSEFQRRRLVPMLGSEVAVVSPEDLVLAKLEWASKGDSERQRRDAARVMESLGAALDHAYVERWLDALAVREEWERVRAGGPQR